MIVALSGTPGTGKTSVAKILQEEKYEVISVNDIAFKHDFLQGIDKKRNSNILDIERINEFICKNYAKKNLVFIDGHAAHFLQAIERVVILRCHPKELKIRLEKRGWNKEKIRENVEAEILDVILCDTVENFKDNYIFEIDTTHKKIQDTVNSIIDIIQNDFKPITKYNIGKIDWSEEILKDI